MSNVKAAATTALTAFSAVEVGSPYFVSQFIAAVDNLNTVVDSLYAPEVTVDSADEEDLLDMGNVYADLHAAGFDLTEGDLSDTLIVLADIAGVCSR